MSKEIVVVGGGAAGMMAAISAAEKGAHVTLLEPNERLGKKLNITGKGRCNVTNDAGLEELLANVPKNGKFLYSAFSRRGTREPWRGVTVCPAAAAMRCPSPVEPVAG